MLDSLIQWVGDANSFLWGPFALIALAAIGIYLTVGTKFVHIKKFGYILKKTIKSATSKEEDDEAEGVLTSSQSLFTSLASVIGMGSIVGVASALVSGGPALYVRNGLKKPYIGETLTILMVLVCLTSTMVQSNVIVENVINIVPGQGVSRYIMSIFNVIIAGIVIVGGIKRIGSVAEKLVPFMSGFYLITGIFVIVSNARK